MLIIKGGTRKKSLEKSLRKSMRKNKSKCGYKSRKKKLTMRHRCTHGKNRKRNRNRKRNINRKRNKSGGICGPCIRGLRGGGGTVNSWVSSNSAPFLNTKEPQDRADLTGTAPATRAPV